jgi:3',5'-cyclic AMP phosphodiesterase CpdA
MAELVEADPMAHLDRHGRRLVAREVGRRGFLKCASWSGAAVVWTVSGGVLSACGAVAARAVTPSPARSAKDLFFVQLSDSHIGFTGPANPDVLGSFTKAVGLVNALPQRPAFVMHTGDLTHTATPAQFDTIHQLLGTIRAAEILTVPGEHDTVTGSTDYLRTFGKGSVGEGWYSYDVDGVHFLALNNVVDISLLGHLGTEQLAFIKQDLASLSADTPLVVFAHIPLWTVFERWGWGTDDAAEALSHMRRFGSVTVLNGHIHQAMSKVEGNVTFHTMPATAYPLPAPGTAPAPSPVTLPAGQLAGVLGIREVQYRAAESRVALTDEHLG